MLLDAKVLVLSTTSCVRGRSVAEYGFSTLRYTSFVLPESVHMRLETSFVLNQKPKCAVASIYSLEALPSVI